MHVQDGHASDTWEPEKSLNIHVYYILVRNLLNNVEKNRVRSAGPHGLICPNVYAFLSRFAYNPVGVVGSQLYKKVSCD